MTVLTFLPFNSSIDPTFWHSLTKYKLEIQKLTDAPVSIQAQYSKAQIIKDRQTGGSVGLPSAINLEGSSLGIDSTGVAADTSSPGSSESVTVPGTLKNFNTVEDFKNSDKQKLFDDFTTELWSSLTSSPPSVEHLPKLASFLLLTFADLKKYKYYYWFAFPAFVAKPPWETEGDYQLLSGDEIKAVSNAYSTHLESKKGHPAFWLLKKNSSSGNGYEAGNVWEWDSFFANVPENERLIAFLDPSSDPSSPGWPLRNFLAYLSHHFSFTQLTVIGFRDTPHFQGGDVRSRKVVVKLSSEGKAMTGKEKPSAVGWEKNAAGKLGPRMADLGPLMDPTRLADQAVDLNLKLMRWRILPGLDLDKVKQTKCLLLGAGTLGCYVARTLMAWGVQKITLLDSATVSFSNPVRQPLFEFEDCLSGGKPKAEAAAHALKKIYPGVDATGVSLSIPMPGHPVPSHLVDKTKNEVEQIEKLVDEHDVIYLLMDSRESRWLPTVLGAAKEKLVMNAALGFDSFLVMRHGVHDPNAPPSTDQKSPFDGALGCYFCNDVVAPEDSLSDRTLDQMCTVTRPGLAAIASATAVELMVSVLQHPKGGRAPSDVPVGGANTMADNADESNGGSVLGQVPHQIRGFLAQFHNMKVTGRAYDRCTACSDWVVSEYKAKGFPMLLEVFNDNAYLEKLTGLDKLKDESEALMESLDWDEDEDGL